MTLFYAYMDTDLGALDPAVTVVKVNKPLDDIILPDSPRQCRLFLDDLYDREYFNFYSTTVSVNVINALGYTRPLRSALELSIPRLSLETRCLPEAIVVPVGQPGSFYYQTTYCYLNEHRALQIARWVGWHLRREKVTEQLQAFYPEYGWDKNNGSLTRAHALACLEHGIVPHYHHTLALRRVPALWLEELRQGDFTYHYRQNYILEPPWWWLQLFGDVPGGYTFLQFLSPEEQEVALRETGITTTLKYVTFMKAFKPK